MGSAGTGEGSETGRQGLGEGGKTEIQRKRNIDRKGYIQTCTKNVYLVTH